jgi:guanylate kinase
MGTGKLIVLTGPSGVGKGTLLKALLHRHPDFYLSTSVTTRSPRLGEIDGQHYFFQTRPQFQSMVEQGDLLEWAEFAGNCYGTPRRAVADQVAAGKTVILEIELEGARQIKHTFPSAMRIFVAPPSLETLEQRLRGRGQDSEEAIARRLAHAQIELDAADEFDVQVVNGDLDIALQHIENALYAPLVG